MLILNINHFYALYKQEEHLTWTERPKLFTRAALATLAAMNSFYFIKRTVATFKLDFQHFSYSPGPVLETEKAGRSRKDGPKHLNFIKRLVKVFTLGPQYFSYFSGPLYRLKTLVGQGKLVQMLKNTSISSKKGW